MPARARRGSGVGRGAARSQIVASIQPPCTPDGRLDRLEVAGTHTGWRCDGLAEARLGRRQPHPGWRSAAAASWSDGAPQPGKAARRCGKDIPATARCRRCGRHGLVKGPAGPGSTALSPDDHGDGVAPAQPRPVAAPASRHRHRRGLLGRCRPSSSPWPATAGPAPPPAARCRAPNTAGRRGCRTAGRGYGRPDSANRRSGGCTDGRRQAWASTCSGGPCRSPSRARWRSPRAGASSGASRGLTALGLVARLQPTHLAGGHGPAGAHRSLTVLPGGQGLPGTV